MTIAEAVKLAAELRTAGVDPSTFVELMERVVTLENRVVYLETLARIPQVAPNTPGQVHTGLFGDTSK